MNNVNISKFILITGNEGGMNIIMNEGNEVTMINIIFINYILINRKGGGMHVNMSIVNDVNKLDITEADINDCLVLKDNNYFIIYKDIPDLSNHLN